MAQASEDRPQTSIDASEDHIVRLREIAETHLREIDQERQRETEAETKKIQDLERYAKRRRSKEDQQAASSPTQTPKMRSAQDVLHRLQWDSELDISKFIVGYLERFEGIKETAASNWITEVTEEEWIPQHRIKYFKRVHETGDSEIVWDRDQRIDRIFGSGVSGCVAGDDVRTENGGVAVQP